MARATTPTGGDRRRPPATAPTTRTDRAGYVTEVVQELRKVTWPTPKELTRMTNVVALTVVMFALLIGGLDLVLSFAVKPIYTQVGTAGPSASPQPKFTPVSTAPPSRSSSPSSSSTSSSLSSTTAGGAPATTPRPTP